MMHTMVMRRIADTFIVRDATLAQRRAAARRGKRFVALAGEHRIVYDADTSYAADEPKHLKRKSSEPDD
jgi:hypothetical protein